MHYFGVAGVWEDRSEARDTLKDTPYDIFSTCSRLHASLDPLVVQVTRPANSGHFTCLIDLANHPIDRLRGSGH